MNEFILSKGIKILLIEILKRGTLKRCEAEIITKGFDLVELTDEQLIQALQKIKPKNLQ